jgi:hypothetical protein
MESSKKNFSITTESQFIALLTYIQVIKEAEEGDGIVDPSKLQDRILENGGILRVSVGYNILDFLDDRCEDGVLKYNPYIEKYEIVREAA